MGRAALSLQTCTNARAVALVGDEWTILIRRELCLGTRRFDDFLSQTAMYSRLLSRRLKKLESEGFVRRVAYSQRPSRCEYRLATAANAAHHLLRFRALALLRRRQRRISTTTTQASEKPAQHRTFKDHQLTP